MDYRHTLFYIDDFKEKLDKYPTELMRMLQSSYDRTSKTNLKRDGTHRERAVRARGLLGFSGEDFPMEEESLLSRMILVNVGKFKDQDKGAAVLKHRSLYSGVTAHFVKFVYRTERKAIRDMVEGYIKFFEDPIRESQDHALRVSQNLSMNMTAFHLAMEMFYLSGVINDTSRDELIVEHKRNLETIRTTICGAAAAQKGARVFLNTLDELLQDRSRFYIEGFPDHERERDKFRNARPLGYWRPETPTYVHLYPGVSYGEASEAARKSHHTLQAQAHIARQLVSMEFIPAGMYDPSSSTFSRQMRNLRGGYTRVWVLKLEALGLAVPGEVDRSDSLIPTGGIKGSSDFMSNIQ
jgi:hypothetical protein